MDDDDLMTTAEVAALYHRPEGTLRQWRHRGYGPKHFLLGGIAMYRRSNVQAFLADCEAQADNCEQQKAS